MPDNAPRLRRNERDRKDDTRAPWARDPAFLKLERQWNRILDSTGLKDIERNPHPTLGGAASDTSYLHHHSGETMRQARIGALNGGREFYTLAEQWLGVCQFKSVGERWAWVAHAHGIGAVPAARRFGAAVNRMWVQRASMKVHAAATVDETMTEEWQEL